MSRRYLLDSNILSDLVRHPQGAVVTRIASVGEETICTSIVAAAELRYGASKSDSKKLADRVNLILSALGVCRTQGIVARQWEIETSFSII